MTPPTTQPSRTVGRELFWLALLVQLFLTASVGDALLKALSPGSAGAEEGVALLTVIVATFPLVPAIAFLVVITDEMEGGHPAALFVYPVVLLAALFFGNALAGARIDIGALLDQVPSNNPLALGVGLLGAAGSGLLELYGPGTFLAAVAIGGYGGVKAREELNR